MSPRLASAAWAGLLLLSSGAARAQEPRCDYVNPDIQGASPRVDITAVPEGYRYDYTVVNPATSTGCVDTFAIEVGTDRPVPDELSVGGPGVAREPRLQIDAGRYVVPGTYSARQCQVPYCEGRVGGRGVLTWTLLFVPSWFAELGPDFVTLIRDNLIEPGESLAVATIVSPYPPGPRKFFLRPIWLVSDPNTRMKPPPDTVGLFSNVEVIGTTIGPVHPDDLVLWNGGGQRPADVNGFLSYSYPTDARTRLPAAHTTATVAVRYGGSTLPATFRAELNGADVTARFAPAPGRHEAVTLPLAPGSNTLLLRIDGTTSSGRTATDSDRLVFLVGG